MDPDQEAFVILVTTFFSSIEVHLDQKVRIAALITDKAPVAIPAEYLDFEDVFSEESAVLLPEHIEINMHAIDLEE